MYWRSWSDSLKAQLDLDNEPIAVSFTGAAAAAVPGQGKLSVCQALKKASEGETVAITAETCGCPGGLVSLGLGQMPSAAREKLVDFLVDRERVYCSRVALHRGQQTVPPPVGMASRVSFSPLSGATVLPDLVAFLSNPGSLHHLLGFAAYWDGGSLKAELAGPACRTGIAYPVVTGEIGLSLLDFGARRLAGFGKHQLLVGVPFSRMIGIMHAFAQGVGRGHETRPESIERQIDEFGNVEPV